MAFPYFKRLSRRNQHIYQRSDTITEVPLGDPAMLSAVSRELAADLVRDDRAGVESCCGRLVAELLRRLEVGKPVEVLVLDRRPSDATSELHGLYTQDESGRAQIRVWMRTAALARVVAHRTFLRTLLHEVCHHLDFELYGLTESFHTEGFFRRESSLARQLLGASEKRSRPPRAIQGELFP